MENNLVLEIYRLPQTVFTLKEISILFPKISYQSLKDKLSYAVETGKLIKLRKGVYAKNNFNPFELANKIFTPSYISLETVLQKEGIIFQSYETIIVASYLTRRLTIGSIKLSFRKIQDVVLLNHEGIKEVDNYFIASKERAFLDALFLYKNYHFDNLRPLDWESIFQLKKIYQSKILEKRVDDYYQLFKKDYV